MSEDSNQNSYKYLSLGVLVLLTAAFFLAFRLFVTAIVFGAFAAFVPLSAIFVGWHFYGQKQYRSAFYAVFILAILPVMLLIFISLFQQRLDKGSYGTKYYSHRKPVFNEIKPTGKLSRYVDNCTKSEYLSSGASRDSEEFVCPASGPTAKYLQVVYVKDYKERCVVFLKDENYLKLFSRVANVTFNDRHELPPKFEYEEATLGDGMTLEMRKSYVEQCVNSRGENVKQYYKIVE